MKQESRGVAQPGSAPALGAGGRRFKSYRPDQFFAGEQVDFATVSVVFVMFSRGLLRVCPKKRFPQYKGYSLGAACCEAFLRSCCAPSWTMALSLSFSAMLVRCCAVKSAMATSI